MQTSPFIVKDLGFCFSQSQKNLFHFYPAEEYEAKYSNMLEANLWNEGCIFRDKVIA